MRRRSRSGRASSHPGATRNRRQSAGYSSTGMHPGRAGHRKPSLLRAGRLPAPQRVESPGTPELPGPARGQCSRGRRGSENPDATKQMGRQEPRSRLPGRRRRFGFHTETRNWRSAWAPDTGRTAGMRRPAWILPRFANGDGCRGFRQAPRGGAPAGILTEMPTTADNRGPGLESGRLRYDDGHAGQTTARHNSRCRGSSTRVGGMLRIQIRA